MENQKPTRPKEQAAKPVSPAKPGPAKTAAAPIPAAPSPIKVPPLFRKIDWLTMLIAFGVVWIVYFLTLAPEVTLEDSGELCTGAFYAGIPHPPGYPFWSIYSWLWTSLLPMGNVAWRVEVGESFAAAMACGMVGLMVSRGSSMLVEGIEELKGLTGRWESAICMVSGAVAGISLGFGGVMWSESVAINRISLFGVPWMMMVLLLLLRWIYAPHQRRYLFFAMFIFGICTTIHQTLLCAGLGIEACIAMANPRLGRNFFHWNSFLLLGGVIVKTAHMTSALNVDNTLLLIFSVVLIGSIILYALLAFVTRETAFEFWRDATLAAAFLFAVYAVSQKGKDGDIIYWLLSLAAFGGFGYFAWVTRKVDGGWLVVFACGILVAMGAAFYFWEPITGMTNPPMEWGYPRTVDGFWHALSRGQYEQAHPTDLTSGAGWKAFYVQLGILISGIAEEYNWVLLFAALVPLLFIMKMKKRERSWIIGLVSIYFFIGILLVILMNPQEEKQSVDLHKVFFTSSHGLLAILMGYGLTLISAYMATHYRRFRTVGLMVGGLALLPALIAFYNGICNTFFWGGEGLANYNYQILIFLVITAAFVLVALAAQMLLRMSDPAGESPDDAKMFFMMSLGGTVLSVLLAVYLAFFNERSLAPSQVFGMLPRLFSLRLANLPAQAGALIVAIAVAFIIGLVVRRDRAPLALTLGLFALMPVASIMSHWGTSEQRNHWFGYWYGHDMFSAPFTAPDGHLTYNPVLRAAALKGTNADLVYPEIEHNAILFGGTDPGRFTPTYMIFCESFIPHKDQPIQDQNYDRRDVYIITQNALADDTYLDYLRAQYNRSQQIDPPFFQELLRGSEEVRLNYTTNWLARLAYQVLDKPLTRIGAEVEARRRAEGVYPPKEIYIPSPEDLSRTFTDYQTDIQQRYIHDNDPRFNGEPRQLKAGEQPTITADGRMSIAGQVSVMAVNGLLTKLIFDHNPTNEFYVEESFPLDWMFPHLTPYGDIMKINREPVMEITPEIVRRDHEFWSRYSDRLIGNWITYDTTVKQITDFVDKAFVQHDFSGFTGNRAFMRDESAQKSFSKLRTAIAGLYAWRLGLLNQTPTPTEFLPRSGETQQRMIKETDFAYKQAFAYCPYSPEVVYRYVQFLATFHRFEDARLVAETCLKLDPNNDSIANMVHELQGSASAPQTSAAPQDVSQAQAALAQLEKEVQEHPGNLQAAGTLAQMYLRLQQGTKAVEVLDAILANTNAGGADVSNVVAIYYSMRNFQKLEVAFRRLVQVSSDVPENWYNLASLESALGQTPDSLKDLRRAFEENAKRLARNPSAIDLQAKAATDPNFGPMTNSPEFQALIAAPR
jgi:tetratricopeptide (TPR) repeat protein